MADLFKERPQLEQEVTSTPKWSDFEASLPTLKVRTIKDAGHRPWMDDPAAFRKALNTSLNR
jgi:pimeloyl-ACP methyl ester carboxylesterase